jgi:hypothetical protein
MRRAVAIAAFLIFVPLRALGQDAPAQPPSLADEIARLKSGNFDLFDIEFFTHVPPAQAIPVLEAQFEPTKDALLKAHVAAVLVRLGDKQDTYWNFLVTSATEVIDNGPPFPFYDPQTQSMTKVVTPAFTAWAQKHNLSTSQAWEEVVYNEPGFVAELGRADDPRAIPLLRRALQSSNFLVQTMGAAGLAQLQDKQSIGLIIEACQKGIAGRAIAMFALIFFDDPDAQRAVDKYVPKDAADSFRKVIRDEKKTPLGVGQ